MQKLKKTLNQKGATLVELLVGMVICGIIMLSVAAVLVPALNAYATSTELSELNLMLDTLQDDLTASLKNATAVAVVGDELQIQSNLYNVRYKAQNDILQISYSSPGTDDFDPVLDTLYYKNKRLQAVFSLPNQELCTVQLTLFDKGDAVQIQREFSVKLLLATP